MRSWIRIAGWSVLAGGLLLMPVAPAGAQEEPEEPEVPYVGLGQTAAELARSGIAREDPRSVLAAAQIMITAERPTPGLEMTEEARPGRPPGVDEAEAEKAPMGARGLLREAVRLAVEQGDRATAQAAIALAESEDAGLGDTGLAETLRAAAEPLMTQTRGAVGGPVWAEDYLYPENWVQYDITFQGGYVPNRVNVHAGNRYADLDCYLYDQGRLVAQDTRYYADCGLSWNQAWTGTMRIVIWNRGAGSWLRLQSN